MFAVLQLCYVYWLHDVQGVPTRAENIFLNNTRLFEKIPKFWLNHKVVMWELCIEQHISKMYSSALLRHLRSFDEIFNHGLA